MSYLPLTEQDRKDMLHTIGVGSFSELIAAIPRALQNPPFRLRPAVSELELQQEMADRASQNAGTSTIMSYAGAGAYEHYIPSIISHITSRSEFYTAYTPYQAEASQGTLQAIYEYQSMMCMLTGMDVSNASHYDGATSTAEAALLATTMTQRKRILVARSLHPEYRSVLTTYAQGSGCSVIEMPLTQAGTLDTEACARLITEDVACCIVQTPNFFGLLEDLAPLEKLIHTHGGLLIMVANPLSLAVLKTPGEWNADIACGDAQVFGNSLSYGGPYVGYFTVKKELMRKIPGRLVGMTKDREGKRAFTLTLQTREQHIRREKATSNICSNQALCALTAAIYLTAMGKEGLKQVAYLNMQNTSYVRGALHVCGCPVLFDGPVFNEFVIKTKKNPDVVIEELLGKNILAGVNVGKWYSEYAQGLLVCVTETKSKHALDTFVREVAKASQ